MRRTVAMAATLALSGVVHAQTGGLTKVNEAVREIMTTLPEMQCGRPEIWDVRTDAQGAARFLLRKLEERGWALMDYGAMQRSYAMIVDPNPNDPNAVALGGLLHEQLRPSYSTAFLVTCKMAARMDEGTLFTFLPNTSLALH